MLCLLLHSPTDVLIEAPIVPHAQALEEAGRFKVHRTFDATFDFYRHIFKQRSSHVRFKNIINLPGIKAKHIDSLMQQTHWEGINIYEKQGNVFIYVIPRNRTTNANEHTYWFLQLQPIMINT